MSPRLSFPSVALFCAVLAALPEGARAGDAALRSWLFVSDDADDTSVVKASAGFLFDYSSPRRYLGVVGEQVRIRPRGGDAWVDERLYLAFASEGELDWTGMLGTDRRTVLGNVSAVRAGRVRQEYFLERDRLETPLGVAGEGLYHTFLGAALDLPLDGPGRHQVTLLAGAQDFTGENLRTHVRARYAAVVAPERGLSLQMRSRAFHNTVPFEADYYSPEWFVEVMPTAQIRRFRGGWMYLGAAGWGGQRAAGGAWRQARLVEVSVASPQRTGRGHLRVNALYSNTPVGSGASYGYRQFTLEWVKPF